MQRKSFLSIATVGAVLAAITGCTAKKKSVMDEFNELRVKVRSAKSEKEANKLMDEAAVMLNSAMNHMQDCGCYNSWGPRRREDKKAWRNT